MPGSAQSAHESSLAGAAEGTADSAAPRRPPPGPGQSLKELEAALSHSFHQKELLARAVTHSSLAYERAAGDHPKSSSPKPVETSPEEADNEQLEFLGDAVVGLLVAESLCRRLPALKEGQLTRLRAALVSRQHLGEVAALLELGKYLRLGRGEERSGGRNKSAILANCIEAVIGALYLDAGLDPARLFVERQVIDPYLSSLLSQMEQKSTIGDDKSALQELLQALHAGPPVYTLKSQSGPDHRKRFVVEVSIPGIEDVSTGSGATKKQAEQEAARRAYQRLQPSREDASLKRGQES